MNREINKNKLQEIRHYSPPNAVIKQGQQAHGTNLTSETPDSDPESQSAANVSRLVAADRGQAHE